MQEWIVINWLALYGAIVGSIALIINFSKFIHTIRKDKINIKLSVSRHPQATENIALLKNSQDKEPCDRRNLVEVYQVIVRNVGSVNAYLEDVGVVCMKGSSHSALTSSSIDGGCILVGLTEANRRKRGQPLKREF